MWGTITLFVATAIFYIGFFALIYYWRVTRANFVVVPIIFTFEFFLIGFLIVSIISLVLQYLPEVLNLIVNS